MFTYCKVLYCTVKINQLEKLIYWPFFKRLVHPKMKTLLLSKNTFVHPPIKDFVYFFHVRIPIYYGQYDAYVLHCRLSWQYIVLPIVNKHPDLK